MSRFAIILGCAALAALLQGCGAVAVLEEENEYLRRRVDSLEMRSMQLNNRANYLERENLNLDDENREIAAQSPGAVSYLPPATVAPGERPPQVSNITIDKPQYTARPRQEQSVPEPVESTEPVKETPAQRERITSSSLPPPKYSQNTERIEPYVPPQRNENSVMEQIQRGGTNVQPRRLREPMDPVSSPSQDQPSPAIGERIAQADSRMKPGRDAEKTPSVESRLADKLESGSRSGSKKSVQSWSEGPMASGGAGTNRSQTPPQQSVEGSATNPFYYGSNIRRPPPPAPNTRPAPNAGEQEPDQGDEQMEEEQDEIVQEDDFPEPTSVAPPSIAKPVPDPVRSGSIRDKADVGFLGRYQQALHQHKAMNYREAISQFNALIASNPANEMTDNCAYWIGEAYFALGEYGNAVESFNSVLAYEGSDKADDAMMMRANSRVKLNETSRAAEDYRTLVARWPKSEYASKAKERLRSLR